MGQFTLKNLNDGPILRNLTKDDRESLLDHVKDVYQTDIIPEVAVLTEELLDNYPYFSLENNFVIIDTKKNNQVVAWLCLISKTCIFKNIELKYAQMDMVGTRRK